MATITTRYKGFKITTRDFDLFYVGRTPFAPTKLRGNLAYICSLIDDVCLAMGVE